MNSMRDSSMCRLRSSVRKIACCCDDDSEDMFKRSSRDTYEYAAEWIGNKQAEDELVARVSP